LQGLIFTVDQTILHLKGKHSMKPVQLFDGLRERQQKYQQEAEQKYGKDVVQASARQWQGYSEGKQQSLIDEGNAIYAELALAMPQGASGAAVQALVARWHEHMRHFWPAEREHLPRLAATYATTRCSAPTSTRSTPTWLLSWSKPSAFTPLDAQHLLSRKMGPDGQRYALSIQAREEIICPTFIGTSTRIWSRSVCLLPIQCSGICKWP
jgi:hypothetical protein